MFTKNYYKLLGRCFAGAGGTSLDSSDLAAYNSEITFGKGYINSAESYIAKLQTLMNTCKLKSKSSYNSYFTSESDAKGVIFGNGNTAPTINDHALAGDHLTTATITPSFSYTRDTDGITSICQYTILNNGTDAFTVSEVGLAIPWYGKKTTDNSSSSGKYYPVLIERSLLDTPVTIPAGGVGVVTYTIRMDYPT